MTNMVREAKAWTDAQILEVLHMRDHDGLSAKEIAAKTGRTKNSIVGLWNRIRENEHDGDAGDGTMPPRWWER